MSDTQTVTTYLQAQAKAGELRAKAAQELRDIIADAERQLELIECPAQPKKKAKVEPPNENGSIEKHGKFCKLCEVAGHDGRLHAHRKHPEKFTSDELAAL